MTQLIPVGRPIGQWLCAVLCTVAVRPALADSISRQAEPQAVTAETDVSLGRALFDRGKALYEANQLREACEAFAQSHSMRPDTTALLALATCHRDQRRLGSALAEFTEGQARAHRESDAAVEQYAAHELAALQTRLSTVLVEVSPPVAAIPGLELEVDGYFIEASAWNVPVPYDGGEHTISARAPGRHPWRTTKTLQPASHPLRVRVPMLEEDERAAEERPPIGSMPFVFAPHDALAAGAVPWGPLEGWGVTSMGVGAMSLGMMVPILLGAKAFQSDPGRAGVR
jgi:hypothetical protein